MDQSRKETSFKRVAGRRWLSEWDVRLGWLRPRRWWSRRGLNWLLQSYGYSSGRCGGLVGQSCLAPGNRMSKGVLGSRRRLGEPLCPLSMLWLGTAASESRKQVRMLGRKNYLHPIWLNSCLSCSYSTICKWSSLLRLLSQSSNRLCHRLLETQADKSMSR